MNDNSAKQQIVGKIKDSSNILVTVSKNPSVDELSAALGLTVLLNKMNKHATAVFSGAIPPAITFLDPEKTFENTVDSLRDFIIALDKEKADHLRYKVDGDVVKIFITPYRTTITSDDLDFSQGDYNVELVVGLGVHDQDDLDQALAAHGRILHDAVVTTVSAGDTPSELGSIDWHSPNASSLSEMTVSLAEGLKSDKPLLDEQIATAFLTGIVAATDRFSNDRTTSKAMTVAADLMSAGANQQLIASKLQEAHEIGSPSGDGASENSDGTTDLEEGEATKVSSGKAAKQRKKAASAAREEPKKADGSLVISHEKQGTLDEVSRETEAEHQEAAERLAKEELAKLTDEIHKPEQVSPSASATDQALAEQLASVSPGAAAATPSVADLQEDLAEANAEINDAARAAGTGVGPATLNTLPGETQPSMGGTLNATTEQAAEEKRRAFDDDRNRTILTHGAGSGYVGNGVPAFQSPLNAASQPEREEPPVDPFASPPTSSADTAPTAYIAPVAPPPETLADIDAQNRGMYQLPASLPGASPFGAPPVEAVAPQASAPLPPSLPMPDFSTLPPANNPPQSSGALPPEKLEEMFGPPPTQPPQAPQPTDPNQFKIPGQ